MGSNRTCTNKILSHPPHKSFAERNESKDSLVHKRPFPASPKLYPALSPRRRRMAPSSRSRTIFSGNGSLTLGSTRTCTNYIHPHPPYKSFAELFQKRPFPRPPNSIPQSLPVEGGWLRPAARERSSQGTDRSHWEAHGLAQTISIPIPHIKVLRSFSKSDRSPVPQTLSRSLSP